MPLLFHYFYHPLMVCLVVVVGEVMMMRDFSRLAPLLDTNGHFARSRSFFAPLSSPLVASYVIATRATLRVNQHASRFASHFAIEVVMHFFFLLFDFFKIFLL